MLENVLKVGKEESPLKHIKATVSSDVWKKADTDPTLKLEGGTFAGSYMTTCLTNSCEGDGNFCFVAAWYTIRYDVNIVIELKQVKRCLEDANVCLQYGLINHCEQLLKFTNFDAE
jgi:hypothetical protein